jgi:glycosyltransferase involved in cell wall biosynthesis
MTSYNREQYIAEAIESVLTSTYTNFELIIVDDASKDRTVEIAKAYAQQDQRIAIYVNEQNLGDYHNRNKAASYAKGEFIMYVDSDDKILVDGFERCILAMNAFPLAGFGMQLHGAESSPFFMDQKSAIRHHLFKSPILMIGPGGTILRREYFESLGRYPVSYGPANDLYFNLKAAATGGVLMLPFSFNFYRIHEGQEQNNKYSYLYNNFNCMRDALNELPLSLTVKQRKWLMNKNRRRFLVNSIRYLTLSSDLPGFYNLFKKTKYGFTDCLKAIFHGSL